MKNLLKGSLTSALLLFAFATPAFAQRDTIYFINHQKVACFVTEVDPDVIVYNLPGETLTNTVYKNTVQKIKLRNGRVQTFAEAKAYKPVKGLADYENVSVTGADNEIQGLYKIGTVSTITNGGNEKIYKRLKMQVAMTGANVIYTDGSTTANDDGTAYFLTGTAYASTLPDIEKFKKQIGLRMDFVAKQTYTLGPNDNNISSENAYRRFTIKNITGDSGIVNIEGKLKDENEITSFQLNDFNSDAFNISYKKGGTTYSLLVSMENVHFD